MALPGHIITLTSGERFQVVDPHSSEYVFPRTAAEFIRDPRVRRRITPRYIHRLKKEQARLKIGSASRLFSRVLALWGCSLLLIFSGDIFARIPGATEWAFWPLVAVLLVELVLYVLVLVSGLSIRGVRGLATALIASCLVGSVFAWMRGLVIPIIELSLWVSTLALTAVITHRSALRRRLALVAEVVDDYSFGDAIRCLENTDPIRTLDRFYTCILDNRWSHFTAEALQVADVRPRLGLLRDPAATLGYGTFVFNITGRLKDSVIAVSLAQTPKDHTVQPELTAFCHITVVEERREMHNVVEDHGTWGSSDHWHSEIVFHQEHSLFDLKRLRSTPHGWRLDSAKHSSINATDAARVFPQSA